MVCRVVGKAVVEKASLAIHANRDRNAASRDVLWQDRLDFLRNDLFDTRCRFDVVAIQVDGDPPAIEVYQNAFDA